MQRLYERLCLYGVDSTKSERHFSKYFLYYIMYTDDTHTLLCRGVANPNKKTSYLYFADVLHDDNDNDKDAVRSVVVVRVNDDIPNRYTPSLSCTVPPAPPHRSSKPSPISAFSIYFYGVVYKISVY